MSATADPDEMGFLGLIEMGMTPAEAWQVIHDDLLAEPGALRLIKALEGTEGGRAALLGSRQRWSAHGLPPPWEEPQ